MDLEKELKGFRLVYILNENTENLTDALNHYASLYKKAQAVMGEKPDEIHIYVKGRRKYNTLKDILEKALIKNYQGIETKDCITKRYPPERLNMLYSIESGMSPIPKNEKREVKADLEHMKDCAYCLDLLYRRLPN